MTYSVLMGVATQRQEQVAARARLPRLDDDVPAAATRRRTGRRDRAAVATRLRTLMSRT
ncbi:MAG: hypothetical protein WAV00_20525 [Nocardioides sp.]